VSVPQQPGYTSIRANTVHTVTSQQLVSEARQAWVWVQEYTGLKAVYFNSNAISRIEGLDKCTQLRCLYLEQNLLDEVSATLPSDWRHSHSHCCSAAHARWLPAPDHRNC
jgi:hypothetical protein